MEVIIFLVLAIAILLAIVIGRTTTSTDGGDDKKKRLISEKEELISRLRIEKNFVGGAVYFGFNEKNNQEEGLIDNQINQLKREISLLKL